MRVHGSGLDSNGVCVPFLRERSVGRQLVPHRRVLHALALSAIHRHGIDSRLHLKSTHEDFRVQIYNLPLGLRNVALYCNIILCDILWGSWKLPCYILPLIGRWSISKRSRHKWQDCDQCRWNGHFLHQCNICFSDFKVASNQLGIFCEQHTGHQTKLLL